MNRNLTLMGFLFGLSVTIHCAAAEEYHPKAVRIVEINRVRLYIPELWMWPARPRPVVEQPSSVGVGFDSRLERSHVFIAQQYFILMLPNKGIGTPNFGIDWGRIPEMRPRPFPYWFSFGFGYTWSERNPDYGKLNHVGADHRAPDPAGGTFVFFCNAEAFGTHDLALCDATRISISGLNVQYNWDGKTIPQSEWVEMDLRVQKFIEWLALPPSERPDVVDY